MNGSVYWYEHDPARQAERRERMAAIRARSPTNDPANLTTASEIQVELAAYFEANCGRWGELAAAAGCSSSQLGRWLRCPPDQPMLRETRSRGCVEASRRQAGSSSSSPPEKGTDEPV